MNKNVLILLLIFIIPIFGYYILSHKGVSNMSSANGNSPKLIKFTSSMCGECKRVEPVVQNVVTKYQDSIHYIVIPVQINNKYNRDMISKYKVTLVPTIVILDRNGNIIKRIEGYVDENTLETYVRKSCQW